MQTLHILPIASDFGAGTVGSAQGPACLMQSLSSKLPFTHSPPLTPPENALYSEPSSREIGRIQQFITQQIAPQVCQRLQGQDFPVIISGDHSNAIGVLAGLRLAYPNEKIGVLWIDAHADLHTPFTTPSGNLHGMTLTTALNTDNLPQQINQPSETAQQYWQQLKTIAPRTILQPEYLVFMGLRSFEPAEEYLIDTLPINVFSVEQTRQQGISATMQQVAEIFAEVDVLYVSFDVDALDQSLIQATGTPEPNGYQVEEVAEILQHVLSLPALRLFELTEFNPTFDDAEKSCQQRVMQILEKALPTIAKREA